MTAVSRMRDLAARARAGDPRTLEQLAEEGSGQYFAATTPAKLNEIFDVILKSISVRLIQ